MSNTHRRNAYAFDFVDILEKIMSQPMSVRGYKKKGTMASRSYKRIGAQMDKAFYATTYKSKAKMRDPLQKLIDQRIQRNLETKTHRVANSVASDVVNVNYNVFENLNKGATGGNRLGDTVHLKGVRIEYSCFAGGTGGRINTSVPVKFEIFLVKTNQNANTFPISNWFQAGNNENAQPWTTYAGDLRIRYRKNVSEDSYRIVGYKTFQLLPAGSGIGPAAKSGTFYVKCDEKITFRDNAASGAAAGIDLIYPKYIIVAYGSNTIGGDDGAAVPTSTFISTLAYFTDS